MSSSRFPDWLAGFCQHLAARYGPTEVLETHISWVVLAGEFAYKLKKPVCFSFLDYSSAERRRFYCEAELRLNRRLAPELYLEVMAVPGTPEFALRMRRFPAAARLDQVCRRGALTPAHLARFAERLAGLQRELPVADVASAYGDPQALLERARDNFGPILAALPDAADRVDRIAQWTNAEFLARREQIDARRRSGFVSEGHGDLHLENLVLLDDEIVAFDCIEFNEALRWIDRALEVAFLYVDLLAHERADLAGWFLNAWLAATGDHAALGVFRFFAVYRAMVRSLVAALRDDRDASRAYLALAESLICPQPASLTITFGLSGSGKTWQTDRLILNDPHARLIRLRSDIERRRMPKDAGTPSKDLGQRYSPSARAEVYAAMAGHAGAMLRAGWSVVIDATFLRYADRQRFRELARHLALPFRILVCEATVPVLRQRLQARQGDASEATVDVLEGQCAVIDALRADELSEVSRGIS